MTSAHPSCVRAKIRSLEQVASDADALHASSTEILRSLAIKFENPETSKEERTRVSDEMDHVTTLQRKRAVRRNNNRQTVLALERFLTNVRGTLEEVPVALTPEELADVAGSIGLIHKRIGELRRDQRAIQSRPVAASDMRAKATAYVERLKASGPTFNGALDFPMIPADFSRDQALEKTLQVLAWFDGPKLLARLAEMIGDEPDGISDADRKAKLAEIEEQILELERWEEALVVEAQARGLDAERRSHASPAAILGVRVVPKTKTKHMENVQ